jgi:sugar phosphate isomerase/epimerase
MTAMTFGICNEIFQGWKPEESFAYAAQAGYDAIEIAPFTLARRVTDVSAAERIRIRDLARRHRLAICGIHWVLAQTEGLHLTQPDPEVRDRTTRYFHDLIDFCADLGGEVIVIGSPQQRTRPDSVSPEQAWRWAAAVFHEPVRHAQDREVTLCLEPLGPAETNFINTAAEAIEFVERFHSPRFQIILDVKAMSAETKPIPQIIRDSWPRFAHFHANDPNLKGPGFGEAAFGPIAAALKEVGYAGCVSVEVFNFEDGPETIATRSLEYLRRVFGPQ